MARTAVTVTQVNPFLDGTTLSGTAGQASAPSGEAHYIEGDAIPRLHLLFANAHTSTITASILVQPSGAEWPSTDATTEVSQTLPAAAAGIEGMRVVVLDNPSLVTIGTSQRVYVDADDANFDLVTLYPFTWTPTIGG